MAVEGTDAGRGPQQGDGGDSELARLRGRLEEEVNVRQQLVQLSILMNSTLNLSELLRVIMDSAKELCRVEAASILLLDEETGELVFEVALGAKGDDVGKQRIPPGQGIAGQVAQTGEPMVVNAIRESPHFYEGVDKQVGFETRNLLAVPLRVRDRTIGVVEVINSARPAGFDEGDLELATALSSLAAVAIDNARLYQKLSDALIVARMSYRL